MMRLIAVCVVLTSCAALVEMTRPHHSTPSVLTTSLDTLTTPARLWFNPSSPMREPSVRDWRQ
jgi:hypothetical protein